MGPRRQTNDKQPGARVAEGGNRLSPILPVEESTAFRPGHLATVGEQAGAAIALNDPLLERR